MLGGLQAQPFPAVEVLLGEFFNGHGLVAFAQAAMVADLAFLMQIIVQAMGPGLALPVEGFQAGSGFGADQLLA
ncbi:hypothetical protein D3C77_465270 [compost metagenome]